MDFLWFWLEFFCFYFILSVIVIEQQTKKDMMMRKRKIWWIGLVSPRGGGRASGGSRVEGGASACLRRMGGRSKREWESNRASESDPPDLNITSFHQPCLPQWSFWFLVLPCTVLVNGDHLEIAIFRKEGPGTAHVRNFVWVTGLFLINSYQWFNVLI